MPSMGHGGNSLKKLQGAELFVNRKWEPVCVTAPEDRIKTSGLEKIRRKYWRRETVEPLSLIVDF